MDHLDSTVSNLIDNSIGLQRSTVNLEIFVRVLFSRNFAYAKFREIKILTKSLSTTDIGKSKPSCELFWSQVCLLTLFPK